MDLKGKTCLITGAGSIRGMGRAISRRLAGYGAVIMPISHPLYFVPETVAEYVGGFTEKVLGQLGLSTAKGWRGKDFE